MKQSNYDPKFNSILSNNLYDFLKLKRSLGYKYQSEARMLQSIDEFLVDRMNRKKPATFNQIENIWYEGYGPVRRQHYHQSRYHFLNLHSFFSGVGTVELRGFNGTLHAGEIRAYIVLALAMNHQALTQKSATTKKPQTDNPKFAMRTWLNRIGLIGDDYKNCREHLCKHLEGSAAWRFPRAA
jgi:hypothetical protein